MLPCWQLVAGRALPAQEPSPGGRASGRVPREDETRPHLSCPLAVRTLGGRPGCSCRRRWGLS